MATITSALFVSSAIIRTSPTSEKESWAFDDFFAVELAAQLNDIFGGKKKTTTRSASLAPGLRPTTVKGKKKDTGEMAKKSSKAQLSFSDVGEYII